MAKRGNPNPTGGKPDKLMRDALMVALNREAIDAKGKKTKRLYMIADKLVELAAQGEIAAIREIADRVDGRPAQSLEADLRVSRNLSEWTTDELLSALNSHGITRQETGAREPDKLH